LKVYLAGGFRSGWQDQVMAARPSCDYLDPRSHSIKDPTLYTDWDLRAIQSCDYVVAFLENGNPGGYNLALEVGYAHALGKPIVLINEKTRYTSMLNEVADAVFDNLSDFLGIWGNAGVF